MIIITTMITENSNDSNDNSNNNDKNDNNCNSHDNDNDDDDNDNDDSDNDDGDGNDYVGDDCKDKFISLEYISDADICIDPMERHDQLRPDTQWLYLPLLGSQSAWPMAASGRVCLRIQNVGDDKGADSV